MEYRIEKIDFECVLLENDKCKTSRAFKEIPALWAPTKMASCKH